MPALKEQPRKARIDFAQEVKYRNASFWWSSFDDECMLSEDSWKARKKVSCEKNFPRRPASLIQKFSHLLGLPIWAGKIMDSIVARPPLIAR